VNPSTDPEYSIESIAAALRKSEELRAEVLKGYRPKDVFCWQGQFLFLYQPRQKIPFKKPPYQEFYNPPQDYWPYELCKGIEIARQNVPQHQIHLGDVPTEIVKRASAAPCERQAKKIADPKVVSKTRKGSFEDVMIPPNPGTTQIAYVFIEFCCSRDSLLCSEKFAKHNGKDVILVRLTEEHDMTTQEGLEYASSMIRLYSSFPIVLWGSQPCTAGSTWQFVNRYQSKGFDERMAKLMKEFRALLKAYCTLAQMVKDLGDSWGEIGF